MMGDPDRMEATEGGRVGDERCPSGVEGLDTILAGGLPRAFTYLIQGDPGSGKTTVALQFLLEGLRRGERALYITLSETRQELWKVAQSHGWSLEGIPLLELSAIESLLRPEAQTTVFRPAEMELNQLSQLLLEETRKQKPSRVVFDSLSEFRLIAETPLRYRRQLLALKQEFARHESTVLLLDDKMDKAGVLVDPHVLSLSHGVLELEQFSTNYGASRRRLRVLKMRGVKFSEGYHDYAIDTGGIRVFPRLIAAEHRGDYRHESVSSGIPELDDLFGGGLDRGTTSLVMGSAGTGKTTLALQYAVQMADLGEPGIVFAFDETRGITLARAREFGLELDRHVESRLLTLQQIDPAEISPGEFGARVLQAVESGCRLVIIDSLNGYLNSMPEERFLNTQLHELCSYLNQRGVLTILILPHLGLLGPTEARIDLSYLADTVVSLRYFEAAGEVRQAVAVIKKRSGRHEKSIREYKLESGRGIRVGGQIKEFQGVLSGVPVFRGSEDLVLKESDAG